MLVVGEGVQRIISSASFSKIVSEDPNLIFDSSNQDDVILDENPRSSGCEVFIKEDLKMKSHDSSMIENHIIKVQISIMPISSWDRSLNTYEEIAHILPESDEVSFPNQNSLALCNNEDGQPKPKPCNLSFDHFLLSHDELGLTISGDANQAFIFQSTLPSLLEESTFVV